MGDDLEGVDKDGSNGVGLWYDVQGRGTNSAAVRHIKLDGERNNVGDPGGVSPPGRQIDCEYDR